MYIERRTLYVEYCTTYIVLKVLHCTTYINVRRTMQYLSYNVRTIVRPGHKCSVLYLVVDLLYNQEELWS